MKYSTKIAYFFSRLTLILLFSILCNQLLANKNVPLIIKGGNDSPPFEFINQNGETVGFTVDLMKAIMEDLDYSYNLELVPWYQVRLGIESGVIDLATFVFLDSIRNDFMDIGPSFGEVTSGIFSQKNSNIKNLSDLENKIVAVHRGDIMHELILTNQWSDNLIVVDHPLESLKLVELGKADVALMNTYSGLYYIKEHNIENIVYHKTNLPPLKFSFATQIDNPELLWAISSSLYRLKIDGTYDKIYNKWFSLYENPSKIYQKYIIFSILLVVILALLFSIAFIIFKKTKATQKIIQSYVKSAYDISSIGICVLKDDIIHYSNRALFKMINKEFEPKSKLDPKSIFVTDEKFNNFLNEIKLQLSQTDVAVTEVVLESKNSNYIHLLATANSFADGGYLLTFTDITLQREASINLEIADKKLKLHITNSPLAYLELDSLGNIKMWSSKAEELFGWTTEDVIGQNIVEIGLIADDNTTTFKEFTNSLQANSNQNNIVKCGLLTKDGTYKDTILYLTASHYEDGKIGSISCMIHDISDLQEAQNKIAEEQERSRMIFESTKLGIYEWDIETQQIRSNKNFADIVGYSLEEINNFSRSRLVNMVHPDDRNDLNLAIKNLVEHNKKLEVTLRIQHKYGHYITFVNKGGKSKCTKTNKPLLYGILTDVTEERKNQEFIQKLSMVTDQSPTIIAITDKDGVIEYVNQKFTTQTGYKISEVINKKLRIFNRGHISEIEYAEMKSRIKSGKVWIGEHLNRKKNGQSFWELIQISSILDDEGKIKNYLAVSEDITEQKIIQRELINAKERAEESDQLKTLFLNNLSHEVRTPLNSIAGFSEIIHNELSNDENVNFYSSEILKSSRHLLSMMDNIINLSLIETGKIIIQKSFINVRELISDIKNQLLFLSNNSQIIFTTQIIPSDLEFIFIDYQKMNSIILNLVANAIKYSSEGEIKLICEKVNNTVHFSISDEGIGIPDNIQDLIFNKFYQGDNSITGLNSGLGIGLSLVKSYVDLLDGEITFTSSPSGTTFNLSIPCDYEDEHSTISYTTETVKTKVLVVDDMIGDYKIILEILPPNQFEVIHAKNGKEAIGILRNEDISLIILDIYIPKGSGLDILKIVKEKNPKLPVVIYTAYSISKIKKELEKYGYNGLLPKPLNRRTLLSLVNRLLVDSNKTM